MFGLHPIQAVSSEMEKGCNIVDEVLQLGQAASLQHGATVAYTTSGHGGAIKSRSGSSSVKHALSKSLDSGQVGVSDAYHGVKVKNFRSKIRGVGESDWRRKTVDSAVLDQALAR